MLDHLFELKASPEFSTLQCDFFISFLELYNDSVTDLLASPAADLTIGPEVEPVSQGRNGSTSSKRNYNQQQYTTRKTVLPYIVKENNLKGVYIENMSEHRTRTVSEAYSLLLSGLQRRKMFATVKN